MNRVQKSNKEFSKNLLFDDDNEDDDTVPFSKFHRYVLHLHRNWGGRYG